MALTLTKIGTEISTEKLVIKAVTDQLNVDSVIMEIYINNEQAFGVPLHTLEHLPDIGTTDEFSFEVNSIVKDYFDGTFLPLTGVNATQIKNCLVACSFKEVINNTLSTPYNIDFIVKNMTQDVFEIEEFDLSDYNCGSTGSTSSKLLTSCPSPLPIGDKTSVHVSCLQSSYAGTPPFAPLQEWLIQELLNGVLINTVNQDVEVTTRSITGLTSGQRVDVATYRYDFDTANGVNEVRFYIRDKASPFTIRSETKIFELNDACEKELTLSWLNEFGAQDTYSFVGNINRVGKYTDSTFKKVRPVTPLSTDVGQLVYKSAYNYEYDLFSGRVPELTVQWLSKMLVNKRVAIQTKSKQVNCVYSLTNDQYFGATPEELSYVELIDGGNGFAYAAPARSGDFLKYDLSNDTTTTIASPYPVNPNAVYYTFGIRSNVNGKIYYMNDISGASDILVFDPSNDTFTNIGTLTDSIGKPCITPSGVIYANIQSGTNKFFKIDTSTNTITELTFGTTNGGGQALYFNGFVYFIPSAGAGEFYKLDISNDTLTTISTPLLATSVFSAVVNSNGIIYALMIDVGINKVFVLDTTTNVNSVIDTGNTTTSAYYKIFLMSDDNAYILGRVAANVLKIDKSTNAITQAGTIIPDTFLDGTVIGNNFYSISVAKLRPILKLTFAEQCTTQAGKYFPIDIITDESTLEDKFSPETLFRVKFRMANARKGIK